VVVWDALTDVEKVNWTRQLSEDQTNTLWHALAAPTLADQRLESPVLEVGDGDFIVELDHRFKFEQDATANWDGGVIEISTDGGESWQDIGAAAGYGGIITDEAGNPLANREAYVGTSAGHPALTTQTINLGTAFASQSVQIRFRLGTDPAVGDEGWQIDNITFQGITNAPFPTAGADETDCPDPEPEPEPEPNPEDGGCGCQSTGGAGGAGLMLLVMLGVFGRRRRA
jgi:MYXO-CTERM domain-containing protein